MLIYILRNIARWNFTRPKVFVVFIVFILINVVFRRWSYNVGQIYVINGLSLMEYCRYLKLAKFLVFTRVTSYTDQYRTVCTYEVYFSFSITTGTGLRLLVYFVTHGKQVSSQAAGKKKTLKTTRIIIIALLYVFSHSWCIVFWIAFSKITSYIVNAIVLTHPVFLSLSSPK